MAAKLAVHPHAPAQGRVSESPSRLLGPVEGDGQGAVHRPRLEVGHADGLLEGIDGREGSASLTCECGTEFRAGRLACPECGSDAETGWKSSEEIDYQSVELPDDEWVDPDSVPRSGAGTWFLVAAILALIGMLAMVFGVW